MVRVGVGAQVARLLGKIEAGPRVALSNAATTTAASVGDLIGTLSIENVFVSSLCDTNE